MGPVDLVIIGAGWNGLAMAKTYLEAHGEAHILILDYAESIGGTWADERLYPGLKTNNIVGSYEFSDFALVPEKYGIKPGQHIPGRVVHEYLCDFCKRYDLESRIRLRTKVEEVTLLSNGSWKINYSTITTSSEGEWVKESSPAPESTGEIVASRLVLATGLTSEPFMPPLPGREAFKGHVFHAKDFKPRAKDLASSKSVVVIGGNKSAWDVCYSSAARFGADAHMVMRRSGGGPSWVWPARLSGFFTSLSALSSTRFVSWLDPSPFGPSGWPIRAVMNRTWLGRKMISFFWSRLDAKVVSLNAYDNHEGTTSLKPWTSTYWMGNSLGIHNYETHWFDLARNGKITAHAAEVVSLSEHAVHLSDGTSIEADTLVCCTGWQARPNIKFSPKGVSARIGFPGELLEEPILQAKVRGDVLRSAPMLGSQPVRQLPGILYPGIAPPREVKDANSSPYRLYRFVVPYDKSFIRQRNLAVIGAHITIHTAILSQAQALWITAFFDGRIPHLGGTGKEPDYEKIKYDTWYHTEFERMRRPKETGGAGERYPDLVVDSIPYVDMLLSDLELPYHRKQSMYKEIFEPYQVADYKGLVEEWLKAGI
ncbi:hypothetical protein jhhlp_008538 [Lomentospora prolificans]|uniref:L-ornithine N(5)-oxygenase n=1 Tax=Lomentospora prolificans TaxID=41688 RepID=A0A2N3MYB7_9PEZI|nr:hypothetical protein jhhlp_008538 [Lomentospora prolificans]